MKNMHIPFFVLAVVLAVAPLTGVAQTAEAQPTQAELTEAAALRQVALQIEEAERQVLYLALLVQKLALEQQAADLQKQIAALSAPNKDALVAVDQAAPVSDSQAIEVEQEVAQAEESAKSGEDIFAKTDSNLLTAQEDSESPMSRTEEANESGFAAAFGSLQNMGTPQLAALAILAVLAIFVLVRRFRGRKQESKSNAPISPSSSPILSDSQQNMLQEGRQELKENVVWK